MVSESPDVRLSATTPHYQVKIVGSVKLQMPLVVDRIHLLTAEIPTSSIILSLYTSLFQEFP